jgi:NodT family efflux transporter outer membrane factor (OMF) lipoprotein
LRRALNAAVCADQEALKIVKNRYAVGNAAKSDVLASETQLESAQSAAIASSLRRAQYEHAIAVLIGKPPADYALAPLTIYAAHVPVIPTSMPSVLLERRPDIASAERRMASANAEIGVQDAAWYPNLSITASYGFSAQVLSKLFQASNSLWSLGPTVAETIFDGGARSAAVEAASAAYDHTVATYRQTTLTAFQDVEDQMAALNILTKQEAVEKSALQNARDALALTTNQYKEGIISYSDVVTAQITALSHEQSALTVTQSKLAASVSLIRALGGGWDGKTKPQ